MTGPLNSDWIEKGDALKKVFNFKNFKQAFEFMTKVASLAEEMQHHPNWSNSWNIVSFSLQTHDAGNIVTEKDRLLAKGIDEIAVEFYNDYL